MLVRHTSLVQRQTVLACASPHSRLSSLTAPHTSGAQLLGHRPACQRRAPAHRPAQAVLADLLPKGLLGGGGGRNRERLKKQLLEVIAPLQRGLTATPEEADEVERLAGALEAANPTPAPLGSPLLSGEWRLLYTTSSSILGRSKPPFLRAQGEIYQTIDAKNLKAANKESWPFFNQVYADLSPLSNSEVAVQFKTFKLLGLLPIQAPESARGRLDTTYLDEELRISRGDKGNLFVLEMNRPGKKP